MTQDEWLNATDPLGMVNAVARRLGDRKLRLFLVACCRRLRSLPLPPNLWDALAAAERFADGGCSWQDLEQTAQPARQEVKAADREQPWRWLPRAGGAILAACWPPGHLGTSFGTRPGRYWGGSYRVMRPLDAAAEAVAEYAFLSAAETATLVYQEVQARERAEQCRLLRDVAEKPPRTMTIDPSWLVWNSGTVVRIAEAVYQQQAFDRLPILADALEEAGCADPRILGHLRGPGPHVRGCHVLDRLLARTWNGGGSQRNLWGTS